MGGLVGAVVGKLELASDVGIVGADGLQLLLNLGDPGVESDVDVGDLGEAGSQLHDLGLGNLLGVEGLVKSDLEGVRLLLEDDQLVVGSVELVNGTGELLVGAVQS